MWVWQELPKSVFGFLTYVEKSKWTFEPNTIELWFERHWGFIALELANQLDVSMEEEREEELFFLFLFLIFPKLKSSIWLEESDLVPGYILIPGYVLDS